MEMLKHLVIEILVLVALTVLVHGQSQLGSSFISIDCGLSETSAYTDKQTGINYTSDASFIKTGENNNIAPEYDSGTLEQQFKNLRSFPEGKRNCFTIKLARSNTKVLLRARFMYGNYDGQGKLPSFDLILGADLWDSVEFENESTPVTKEIIHVPRDSYIHVCLLNTGSGTPFISAVELRPLSNSAYNNLQSGSLLLVNRWDVGSTTTQTVRYIDDIYDRIWVPYISQSRTAISTSLTINDTQDDFQPPSTVMQTAMIPANGSNSLQLRVSSVPKSSYYITFYFAETEKLQANQKREQNIYISGRFFYGPLVPHSNRETRVFQTMISGELLISINKTENSTLPPILNALEIYRVKEFPQLLTDQQDVDAVMNIKSKYGVQRPNWQGDPCVPIGYMWWGLNCSYNDNNSLRIISLNLSSSGLIGEIPPYLSSLTSMQILDLSNNSLRGSVPDFLSELQVLRVLNLSGNKLTGSIPAGLLEKQKNGQLSLSVEGNPDLHTPVKYKENKKFIVAVVAAVVSVSVLSTALAILWSFKRKEGKAHEKDQNVKHELKIFDFQTIAAATNDFSMTNVLGKGGFGSVYKGKLLDGQDIAIKRLSRSSAQGVEEFQNEANLIAKLQHTNLVRLLGYSLQNEERILVYEYMPNKSLDFFIFDSQRKKLLDWKKRLSIIEGIAQGLIYLHKYSRLRVIHRDLKASNILLDDQMNPKISDFGMARIFGMNESIANTNRIVGTYGYMSPEYAMNGIVSIKTDVYSFGVLVLEILSGKKNNSCYHSERPLNLVGYAWQLWNEDKGLELKDPTLGESCSADELLRCVQVGLLCVQDQASDRPTMSDVVSMLTNETLLLSEPKQPAFYINDTSEVVDSGNKLENYSTNDVTISVMEAR